MSKAYTPSPEQIQKYHEAVENGMPVEDARLILHKPLEKDKSVYSVEAKTLAQVANKVQELSNRIAKRGRQDPQALREALNLLFDKFNFSPLEELTRMVADESHEFYTKDPILRKNILSEISQYVMPKLKAVEVQGKVEHEHTITIVRYGEDGEVRREKTLVAKGHAPAIPMEVEVNRG